MTITSGTPEAKRQLETWVTDIAIRLFFLGLVAYWSIKLISPFLILAVWAAILTTAIYPIYVWLRARLGGRSRLAALLITALGLGLVLGPAGGLIASMAGTMENFARTMASGNFVLPAPDPAVQDWPLVGKNIYAFWGDMHDDLADVVSRNKDVVVSAGRTMLGIVAGLGIDVLMFAASMVIAGFLYSRGPTLAEGCRRFGQRIGGERASSFVDLAGATVRNVSRGVIGVSLLQALLAGIGMLVAGVPAAGLLALGALILAIVQIGPVILLLPVIVWVWFDMDTLTAAIFTIYMVPVLTFDNILKPIVMSRGLKTPMIVILIGVIGGTLAHGLTGLFLGPVVLAVSYELLMAWVKNEPSVPPAQAAAVAQTDPPSP